MAAKIVDGRTNYLQKVGDLRGIEDSKKFVLACWFKRGTDDVEETIFVSRPQGTLGWGVRLYIDSGNLIHCDARNSVNGDILLLQTSTQYKVADDWTWVGVFVDLGAGTPAAAIYVDAVDDTDTDNKVAVDGTFQFNRYEWTVGVMDPGNTSTLGPSAWAQNLSLDNLVFLPGIYNDPSVEVELNRFVSRDVAQAAFDTGPTKGPRPVGHSWTAIGARPAVYFVDLFLQNQGDGGPFEHVGGPMQPVLGRNPERYSAPADTLPDERSFVSEWTGHIYPRHQTFIERRPWNRNFGRRLGLVEMDEDEVGMDFVLPRGPEDDSEDRR